MVAGTDSASKGPASWALIALGLGVCLGETGCARLKSAAQATPVMLGAAAPFRKSKPAEPGGDLYAQEVGKGISESRTLLAQERAKARASRTERADERLIARADAEAPAEFPAPPRGDGLEIALQAPVSLAAAQPARPRADATEPVAAAEPQPAPLPSAEEPAGEANLASVVADAKARLESMTSYKVPIKRQERVGSALLPAEEILLSIRREPRAVRIEWPDGPSKGREVIYSATEHDGLMHVKMPPSAIPVPPLALAPDSPMVKRTSRHPITEAGYEAIVEGLERAVAQSSTPNSPLGKVTYGGLENPGPLEQPAHKIVRVTPEGETWRVFLDPTTKLPVLVEGTAPNGDLLEHYQFGEPTADPDDLAAADAFDPNKRWGPPTGLLSRIARAGTAKPADSTPR
jgi:hypothetical protein